MARFSLLTAAGVMLTVGLSVGSAVSVGGRSVEGPAGVDGAGRRPAEVTLTDVTPEQSALFDWALGLFEAAGLVLPPLRVVGHDTVDGCFGREGAHVRDAAGSIVHLCTRETGRAQEFLYVHELAHAWDAGSLTEARRGQFLTLRGLTEWRNDDPERWHERGAEQAAEIITWGLMDRPMWVVRLPDASCADLLAGYVTLVEREPLHGYTDFCE